MINICLLGVGQVGSAIAKLVVEGVNALPIPVTITAGLVRDVGLPRRTDAVRLTSSGAAVLDSAPDVVIEVLGGLEPARTLILEALARGIPVVTANKTVVAHYGDEILAAAAAARVPFRYEAAVIAGVPFLGTFARRPLASHVTRLTGIVNGTTNYILSKMTFEGCDFATALAQAQAQGFAEPDPSKDVDGIDAAEKLAILIRQFFGVSIAPDDLDVRGIRGVTAADLATARRAGGTIKPIVFAERSSSRVSAFVGPEFVANSHPLAALNGTTNGVILQRAGGQELTFTGPGAGPDVTAITILDDVLEVVAERNLYQ